MAPLGRAPQSSIIAAWRSAQSSAAFLHDDAGGLLVELLDSTNLFDGSMPFPVSKRPWLQHERAVRDKHRQLKETFPARGKMVSGSDAELQVLPRRATSIASLCRLIFRARRIATLPRPRAAGGSRNHAARGTFFRSLPSVAGQRRNR